MRLPAGIKIVCQLLVLLLVTGAFACRAAADPRHDTLLDSTWRSIAAATNSGQYTGFEQPGYEDQAWSSVTVPHNWDDYGGDHRLMNGNFHGSAWYRRTFVVPADEAGRRIFLYFEGVGSYATVWVNGQPAGQHAGGRTTFTLDVTALVHCGQTNILAVRADEPNGIADLPWAGGGDSSEYGFSEGSQPLGIFRPVHLVSTGVARVEPFGVHVWNDATATATSAVVHVETDLRNYDSLPHALILETQLRDAQGRVVSDLRHEQTLAAGATVTLPQATPALSAVHLWSVASPYLYTVETTIREGHHLLDQVTTPFGIRVIHWPAPDSAAGPFLLNAKPVFINGIAEYEHVLGGSHAFDDEQIRARVHQLEAAGFNAFRDGHQPHNLRYQEYWEHDGILWWPQFSAHIWFDTPQFRTNFITLLRDWVRERRNNPAVILWGLQNESHLPDDFASQCTALIRELDPTTSSQRLVTTCNGGGGTDWNVAQVWSGTYSGEPTNYASDLQRVHLVGEYGVVRGLGLHTEGGFVKKAPLSEDRANALLEMKIRLSETVRDDSCGQFLWLLASHENPGRKITAGKIGPVGLEGSDAIGELNGVGPANNKGLLTLWGEPTDLYYLYRANYISAAKDPMVMIVSHTWPDRWSGPGLKNGIEIFSNCEEVELFNDYQHLSLGRRPQGGRGTHFQWDGVNIQYNVLYAEGRVGGKVVATDVIVLNNLPPAPHLASINGHDEHLTAPAAGFNYLYRVNCGGTHYVDEQGNPWLADQDFTPGQNWGSISWAAAYVNVPPRFGSQRETSDIIVGTRDEPLFQTYRYGRAKLRYRFAVPNGKYRVELYFTEPWYGRGGGDCTGWRLFDVAVNGETKLHDLDLWREAGYCHALKKVVTAEVHDGWLEISFPHVASYQAVISAIAIATRDMNAKAPAPTFVQPIPATPTITNIAPVPVPEPSATSEVYSATNATTFNATLQNGTLLFTNANAAATWTVETGLGGAYDLEIRCKNPGPTALPVALKIATPDGVVLETKTWTLPPTPPSVWANSSPPGGASFNAGKYLITLTLQASGKLQVESLQLRSL